MTKKIAIIAFLVLLFAIGITGGYLFFGRKDIISPMIGKITAEKEAPKGPIIAEKGQNFTQLKLYFPVDGRLLLEERRVPDAVTKQSLATSTVNEFFKGPAGIQGAVPGARLLGAYFGQDGILYLDISEELRRDFRGGVLEELLLLQSLYKSLMTNVYDVQDVKLLIEGKEVDSIGGHLSALEPLGETIKLEDGEDSDEERP